MCDFEYGTGKSPKPAGRKACPTKECRLYPTADSEGVATELSVRTEREHGPRLSKLWQRLNEPSLPLREHNALKSRRRCMFLNLCPGVFDIFTGSVDRMATHGAQERHCGTKQKEYPFYHNSAPLGFVKFKFPFTALKLQHRAEGCHRASPARHGRKPRMNLMNTDFS